MKYSIFLSLSLVILFGACNESPSSSDEDLTLSLPFEVGKSWEYSINLFNYQTNESRTLENSIIFTVLSDTVIDGNTWYLFQSDDYSLNRLMGGYYSSQEDGVHYFYSLSSITYDTEINSTAFIPNEVLSFNEYQLSKTSTDIEYFLPPAFPNPTTQRSEYLIQTSSIIGSIIYHNEASDSNGDIIYNYSKYYYQQYVNNEVLIIAPFKLSYQISSDSGIHLFQQAYVSRIGTNENDQRLQPHARYTFELIGEITE